MLVGLYLIYCLPYILTHEVQPVAPGLIFEASRFEICKIQHHHTEIEQQTCQKYAVKKRTIENFQSLS